MTSLYWWRARPNWGDQLAPLLLERFAGIAAAWAPPGSADIITVGSVLDELPRGWEGTVLGAGWRHERNRHSLDGARVLALRGHLSALHVGSRVRYAIGDPGLLVSEIVPVDQKLYDLTVVPHWSDNRIAKRFAHLNPHVVNPADAPLTVLREIAASRKIVSSSLHGVIAADAFRVPRRAVQSPQINARYEGGTFKFDDYSSIFGQPMVWEKLHMPDARCIDRAQAELFDAFRSLGSSCAAA